MTGPTRVSVTIITPPVAASDIEHDLVNLTEYIEKVTGETASGGFLGGQYGYGIDYENETFLMRPYCWCEREDCPWCGGCQAENLHPGHGVDCYQTRLRVLREKRGGYGDPAYSRARTELARAMALDPERGAEVHCTCGGDEEAKRRYDACDCDWHKGRGPFRFGPATTGPNFWHKPSGLMVRWYKWIGRDTEYTPEEPVPADWRLIYAETVASVTGIPSA